MPTLSVALTKDLRRRDSLVELKSQHGSNS